VIREEENRFKIELSRQDKGESPRDTKT